jgi:hypothetical protein
MPTLKESLKVATLIVATRRIFFPNVWRWLVKYFIKNVFPLLSIFSQKYVLTLKISNARRFVVGDM